MITDHKSTIILILSLSILSAAWGNGSFVVRAWTSKAIVLTTLRQKRKAACCRPHSGPINFRSSSLNLFFREKAEAAQRNPASLYQELSSANLSLPFSIPVGTSFSKLLPSSSVATNHLENPCELILRTMEWSDIEAVTDLCVEEYGDDPSQITKNVFSPSFWVGWSDYLALRPLVDWTMRLKVSANNQQVPSDHAVILAYIRESEKDEIVGMVEISRQPPIPNRNPPPFPIPTVLKQVVFPGTKLQGWVTNLLVAPSHRGKGYAKFLMAVCEGIAKSWECESISLHCAANPNIGRIPQELYARLGYLPIAKFASEESSASAVIPPELPWISQTDSDSTYLRSSVVVIEGVPLLYLRKNLD